MARTPLTDFAIRGLAPERGTRVEIWDSKIPGLGVRASGHGTKTFVLMYRFGGHKRRLGFYESRRKRQCAMGAETGSVLGDGG